MRMCAGADNYDLQRYKCGSDHKPYEELRHSMYADCGADVTELETVPTHEDKSEHECKEARDNANQELTTKRRDCLRQWSRDDEYCGTRY